MRPQDTQACVPEKEGNPLSRTRLEAALDITKLLHAQYSCGGQETGFLETITEALQTLIDAKTAATWHPIYEGATFPELQDNSVLVHFENGSIETVHIEDYFAPMTFGLDSEGNQKYTFGCLNHVPVMTHWMPLPTPPEKSE